MKLPEIKFAKTETLVLRCCRHDFTSRDGFRWKKKGTVTAPDWEHRPYCGQGLHGWKHGEGDHSVWEHYESDVWMVLAVKTKSIVELDGKVKFPTCRVLFTGKREIAAALIKEHYPMARVIYGTASAGNYGTATAGYKGTATAGNYGTATAGNYGTATAGNYGTASAGNYGTASAGYKGTASAGNYGTASAGEKGTATAGDNGTASAGDNGTATAGDNGTATAGSYGTATAGEKGIIQIKRYDHTARRYRIVIGYIGESGLEAGRKYKLDYQGQFVEVK